MSTKNNKARKKTIIEKHQRIKEKNSNPGQYTENEFKDYMTNGTARLLAKRDFGIVIPGDIFCKQSPLKRQAR